MNAEHTRKQAKDLLEKKSQEQGVKVKSGVLKLAKSLRTELLALKTQNDNELAKELMGLIVQTMSDIRAEEIRLNDTKAGLLQEIDEDVTATELSTIKSKEDVLRFACEVHVSNTEKKRRAIALCKALRAECEKAGESYPHYRITSHDIATFK
jgi:hypothetical protein